MQLRPAMRIEIDIDDALTAEVMEAGGCKTGKAAVEAGLRLRELPGKRDREGSLDDMRRDR